MCCTSVGVTVDDVADPRRPAWISAAIEGWAPGGADYYARRLGPGQTDRPTIMASWGGPTPDLQSMGGSVLPGLIVTRFEGIGNAERSDESAAYIQWFIGHESAHFWLGHTVRYERSRDSWITEGGADLMAALATKALVPTYDLGAELQREVDECAGLAHQPVSEAGARGQHKAYYACGAVFALVERGDGVPAFAAQFVQNQIVIGAVRIANSTANFFAFFVDGINRIMKILL